MPPLKVSHSLTKTPRHRGGAAGTSLIETLIASALLLVVAVAIFPMFHRAMANNISGADSTQATQHGTSQLEDLLAMSIDSQMFDMANPLPGHVVETELVGDRMNIGTLFWDPGANTTPPSNTFDRRQRIATGSWIANPDDAQGRIIWQRTGVIRQYSYADIASGVIDVTNPNQLATLGHPQKFDNALDRNAPDYQAQFKEEDVTLTSERAGVPEFRTRFWRTF